MRTGAELVWSVCMLRKIWLEDMVRVILDALEKVIVSSIEQFGDDRHVASAVANRLLRRNNESRRTWLAAEHMRDHDGAAYRMREMTVVLQRRGRRAVRAQHSHRVQLWYSMLDPDDRSAVT